MIKGTLYNTKTLPRGTHGCDSERNRSHREQQQLSSSNYSTNTLPKNHHQQQSASQQIYGKVANPSRSVLNDVVNKVPSVIMLPISHQPIVSQVIKSVTLTPSSSLVKMSSSKNNLSNESGDMEVATSQNSTLKRSRSKREIVNANEKVISSKGSVSSGSLPSGHEKGRCESAGRCLVDKHLPILTTSTNCANPKEHFLPSEASLDDDYLSECENCKTAGTGSRYYLDDEELDELPAQETMTLQRKLMNENDENDQQNYYRVSSTLPSNTNKKNT